MPKQDTADRLAADLVEWVERRSTELAEAILGSPLRPQVTTPTRDEALAYYGRLMWLPDGTPNQAGRDQLLARVGAEGFEKIALALAKGG
jgi:hypothetical protein